MPISSTATNTKTALPAYKSGGVKGVDWRMCNTNDDSDCVGSWYYITNGVAKGVFTKCASSEDTWGNNNGPWCALKAPLTTDYTSKQFIPDNYNWKGTKHQEEVLAVLNNSIDDLTVVAATQAKKDADAAAAAANAAADADPYNASTAAAAEKAAEEVRKANQLLQDANNGTVVDFPMPPFPVIKTALPSWPIAAPCTSWLPHCSMHQ